MDNINLFIIMVLLHFVILFYSKNVFATWISYIFLLVQNFIVVNDDPALAVFTIDVVLFLLLLTLESLRREKHAKKR